MARSIIAIGFALLLGTVMGVYAAGVVLLRALTATAGWAARTSRALATAIGTLLTWPLQLLAEFLWDACAQRAATLNALLEEQRELRRVYREDYAGDFPSYRAFLRDWRARQNTATERQSSDARAQAIRLMGLPERFTRGELKALPHPDRTDPSGQGRPQRTRDATDRRLHASQPGKGLDMTFFLTPGRKGEDAVRPLTPLRRSEGHSRTRWPPTARRPARTRMRAIPCRCAVTARPFTLQFERVSPAHRFQIARIEAATEGGGERRLARSPFARAPQLRSYDVAEFDWAGCICPHCRASGLINCNGCGETVCGGRVRTLPNGGRAFACHDALRRDRRDRTRDAD